MFLAKSEEMNFFVEKFLEVDSSPKLVNLFPVGDSTTVQATDSLGNKKIVFADSTARIHYFRYKPTTTFYTDIYEPHQTSFFAKPSQRFYQRIIEIDSVGNTVTIREQLNGKDFKEPLILTFDEYLELIVQANRRKIIENEAYKYSIKTEGDGLSSLLTDITNISIPLPSAGFLSIFGPPKISLRINGAVDIHGGWVNETTEGLTASLLGNTKNEPDFKQQVQVNVNGTIGDKLNISADWNTQNTFEYQNTLKIKYTGYDNEIIKSVEAGNVSLQTTSLIGGSEALFGIKAELQLGPFSLTTIASQKKGEVQEMNVKSGASSQEFNIHAWDYVENHFFLDKIYADTTEEFNFFNKYYSSTEFQPNYNQSFYKVKDVELWRKAQGAVDLSKDRQANLFIDLPQLQTSQVYPESYRDITQNATPGRNEIGNRYEQLVRGIDFIYEEYTGHVTILSTVNNNDIYGAAFRIEGPTTSPDDDILYGEFLEQIAADTSKVILLKLIKPSNLQPTGNYLEAWDLMLKNIYSLGGMEIQPGNFELDILYETPGQDPQNELNGVKLLNAFNLDNYSGEANEILKPDGKFDFFPGRTIITSRGEIIFPVLQPFGVNFPQKLPSELKYQAIYDTTQSVAQNDQEKDRFRISGKYSASLSSTFSIGFNAIENSVKVYLGNRELSEGKDYQVDYNVGQVTIRNDAALVPGADLRITYEQNDLLSLASKTLVGARAIYEFNKNVNLGFTFMNMTQESLNDKVRLGEEPISNSIMGVDFNSTFDMPFVTKMLDNVMSTSTPSSFALKGEFAYIDPDPNTRKSPIVGDGSQSIAYLDDFEGTKKTIPLGISYTVWKDAAFPDSMIYHQNREKMEIMNYKSKLLRFNRIPTDVHVNDIWPERDVAKENSQVTVMDIVFDPSKKGSYNYNEDWSETDSLNKNWGAMSYLLSSSANNLEKEKIEYLEFWAQINSAPTNAKMYIDLGLISEDVIPNNFFDTEDQNNNDRLDDGEDLGIDRLASIAEPGYDASLNKDPANDNFSLNTNAGDYSNINNTEGNSVLTDLGIIPDTEDLNRSFNLEVVNSYFRYEIPLDTNRLTNPFITGGGNKGWYQFKIPLKDYISTVGFPTFTNVEAVRVWFQDVESTVAMRITEFNFVGNQWEELKLQNQTVSDEVLSVTTVSIEENPEYYLPNGVIRERDRSQTDTEVMKNEQSLSLIVEDLPDGEYRQAVKYLPSSQKLDIFSYKQMKLFFHGDVNPTSDQLSYVDTLDGNEYNTLIYFRFGADTANYYEYSFPLIEDWQSITINLSELPPLKELRTNSDEIYRIPVAGRNNHFYGVKGNPSLTKISFFLIQIENPSGIGSVFPTSGKVWVNELRVLGADNTPGWAYTASSSLKLADFITITGNVRQQDPYFHKVTDRFGTRENRIAWGMAVDVNFLKLMPFNTEGSNLSMNYNRTENVTNPLYMPSSDISVEKVVQRTRESILTNGGTIDDADKAEDAIRKEVQSLNVSEAITFSNIKIKIPSREWYFEKTINSLSFNYNYSRSIGRNPTTLFNEMWTWKGGGNYQASFSEYFDFKFADIPLLGDVFTYFEDYKNAGFRFFPNNLSAGVTMNRKYSYSRSRNSDTEPIISTEFVSSRTAGFDWTFTQNALLNLSVKYNLTINSSLNHLLYDKNENLTNEQWIWQHIFAGEYFGKTNSYQQSFGIQTKPKLPSFWGLNRYFTISAGYNVSYSWRNDLNQELLGRSAGYSSGLNTKLTLKWKSLTEPLFPKETEKNMRSTKSNAANNQTRKRGRERNLDREMNQTAADSAKIIAEANGLIEETEEEKTSTAMKSLYLLRDIVKWTFFDYEQFSFSFNQKNSMAAGGILSSGTGFANFWGVNDPSYGPSRLFMLGFSNDIGPRAPNASLGEKFSHSNDVSISTQRPLAEGVDITIDWNVNWDVNKSYTVNTDENGDITIASPNINGATTRSFFTLPYGLLGGSVKSVHDKYDPNSSDPAGSLSNAFLTGMEALPIMSKLPFFQNIAQYIPQPNWRLTWNGIEKYGIFKDLIKRASITHGYSSSYIEGWKINPDGKNVIQTQKVNYSLAPLVGLSLTFNELWGGNLRGDFKFNMKNNYDLGISTRTITEGVANDINLQFAFQKSGFSIPLFGLNLKNDLEFSFSYTNGRSAAIIYKMDEFNEKGEPQDGTTRVTMEPRVKYVMSSRITIEIFYKRSTVEPEGASKIPPTTRNEAGLDVHISIQ